MTDGAHSLVRKLEFDTTLHFLDKYLPPRAALLQVGAEEGTYALHFARRGYRVIATDAAVHVEALSVLALAEGLSTLEFHQGDVTRLQVLSDWDIRGVLCLGPYHSLGARDLRRRCLLECRRVVHHRGIVALSYLTRGWGNETPEGQHLTTPEAVEAEVRSCGFEIAEHVATDGVQESHLKVLERLAEDDYPDFLSAHLTTCCQPSHRGLGTHGLVILKKV